MSDVKYGIYYSNNEKLIAQVKILNDIYTNTDTLFEYASNKVIKVLIIGNDYKQHVVKHFCKNENEVYLLTFSNRDIRLAYKYKLNILLEYSLSKFPFKDDYFDLIVQNDLIRNISDDIFSEYLRVSNRTANLIILLNYKKEDNDIKYTNAANSFFSIKNWNEYFQSKNLKIIKSDEKVQCQRNTDGIRLYYLEKANF